MLKKIADLPRVCMHPEHNPPNMIVLQPGVYEHTCPGCGHKTTFVEYGGPYCSIRQNGTWGDGTWTGAGPGVQIGV